MITAYVINLKRRPDQYDTFLKNNNNLPINITRFEAIDGKEENDRLTKLNKIPVHKQTKHGRFGCFLSHLEVLKLISKRNNPSEWSIISEDDTIIDPELFEEWNNIMEQTKRYKIDILVLSRTFVKKDILLYPLINGLNIVKTVDEIYGTHFYMVNGEGARKILGMKEMDPYGSIPFDVALGIASKRNPVYATIKYDVQNPDDIQTDKPLPMYNKTLMGYAKLSGKMPSSTEEYFQNIKENKNIYLIMLTVLFIFGIFGILLFSFVLKN